MSTPSGPTDTAPHVVSVSLDPTVLVVRLLPGQVVGDLRAVSHLLAPHMGAVALRIESRGVGEYAVVTLLDSDPLDVGFPLPVGPVTGVVVLARDEQGSEVCIDPEHLGHVAVQGATRSGKSAWLYSVLAQLSERQRAGYPLTIGGIDPSGILLRPFSAGNVVLGLSSPAAVESHLVALVADMDARIGRIPVTSDVLPINDDDPLRFVVLEEYPGLLRWLDALDPKTGKRVRALVARLMAEGHKAGIRVVMVAQRAEANVIGSTERGQASIRVSFRVDSHDAVKLLHPDADPGTAGIHAGALPGVALLSAPGVPLARVRAPWIGSYAEYVRRVTGSHR
ncbi:hypothetical protein [Pseudonocardia sp. T1-2H]|uniref:hypothetical protein n=1 Tax=Pseudonocardia sp. T1-2H TaxID=3128899 RepID=UPI003100CC58